MLTRSRESGDLNITDTLLLSGQGPETTTIDATGLGDRAIKVSASGMAVSLASLTVTGGDTSDSGGGIYHASGHLVLSNVVARNNQAAGAGGGVHSYLAELDVQDGSVIRGNSAGASGGGLTGNDLTLTDSTVWGNHATGPGGGIDSGGLTVSGSTIAYNTSVGSQGGGIKSEGAQVDISNSTLVGNHSGGGIGGAILATGGTTLTLNAATISGNTSSAAGESVASESSTVTLINTLISGDCYTSGSGGFSSSGGNLESPGDTCNLASGGTDQYNVGDPMLYPIDSYGGATQTMLPRPGSPALGGGDDGYCLTYDQRGELRSDGQCDVGAVERQAVEPDPVFVDGFESGDTPAW